MVTTMGAIMAGPRPILVVDDDEALRQTLVEQLAVDGEFAPSEAGTAGEAASMIGAEESRFDAIVLDIGLPDGDGRDLCARLRKQGVRMPILMLTGADGEQDIVRGLDSGANDYIAKPFRVSELMARLRAQLRVFDNSEDAVFSVGPYTFRPSAKLLLEAARNRKIRLTEKEAAILNISTAPAGAGGAPDPAERGLGLQQRGDDPHAGDPHLPPPSEDRAGPDRGAAAAHRRRRLSPGPAGGAHAAGGVTPPAASRVTRTGTPRRRTGVGCAGTIRSGRRSPG
jgi:DNA-binding response OmpR family regulator